MPNTCAVIPLKVTALFHLELPSIIKDAHNDKSMVNEKISRLIPNSAAFVQETLRELCF